MNRGTFAVGAVLLLLVLGGLAWFLLGSPAAPPSAAPDPARTSAPAGEGAPAPPAPAPRRAANPWRLRGLGSVAGILREYGTERPLGGVKILLAAGEPGPGVSREGITLEDGSFQIREVPNFDGWLLTARAPAPLTDLELAGVEVHESRLTDLGVLYATPGFQVPGIVVDEGGKPVAGATVRAVRAKASQARKDFLRVIRELPRPHPAVDSATTGADGRFALKRLVPGTYEFEAAAKGHRLTTERGVIVGPESAGRELRFVLGKGFALRGRVLRKTEGPIEGLRVVCILQPNNDAEIFDIFEKSMAVTDERGEFTVEGLGPGTHVVSVEVENEPQHFAINIQIPREGVLEIVIEGDCWLEGRIANAAGEAIPSAQVYVTNFQGQSPLVAFALTGADGRYRINALRSGPVQLFMVQAEGYGPHPEDFMSVLRGGGSDVILKPGANEKNVTLGKGGTVRGKVVDQATGEPVGGVRVSLATMAAMFGGTRSGTSDAQGRFEITDVPMGGSMLVAAKDGWVQPGLTPQTMVATAMQAVMGGKQEDAGKGLAVSISRAGEVVERTLEMARGGMLAGVVVAPDGTPVSGARVSVQFASAPGGMMRQITSFFPLGEPRNTGTDGAFEIPSPPAGQKVVLLARAQGYLEGRSDAIETRAEDQAGLQVKLLQGAVLTGKVTGPGGKPVEGATVRYTKQEEGQDWGRPWRLRSARPHRTGEDGGFRIENVESGPLAVQVSHPRHVSVSKDGVETAEAKTVDLQLALASGASISGKVVGPDGRPFGGARIEADLHGNLPEGTDRYYRPPEDVVTGSDGLFEMTGLVPGKYQVVAHADGAADSESAETETGAPALTLHMAVAHTISGVVRTRAGGPLSNVRVRANRAVGEESREEGSANTNREGRFEIRNLPQGTYEIRAEAGWGIGSSRPNLVPATVAGVAAGTQDVVVEVEEGLRISGIVVRGDGTPVPEGWVNANRIAGPGEKNPPQIHANAAILEGKFELTGLVPGRYAVGSQSNTLPWKTVTAEAGAENVKIQYGLGGGIEGRVVRPDGTGLPRAWVSAKGPEGDTGAQSGDDGRFAIKELPAGSYDLSIYANEGERVWNGTLAGVGVSDGGPTTGVEIAAKEAPVPAPGTGE